MEPNCVGRSNSTKNTWYHGADVLAENAVNLATVAIGLNDPYNIENFDDARQGLMNALVASAPRQVAP